MNAPHLRLSRRDFSAKLLAGVILAAVPTIELAGPALAGRTWCKTDPGLRIGGRETHINLYSYREMFDAATGPVKLVVTVPVGDEGKTELLYMDDGFNHGYELVIKRSKDLKNSSAGIDILVQAFAPASNGALPVKVEVVPVDRGKNPMFRKGQANQWIPVKGKI